MFVKALSEPVMSTMDHVLEHLKPTSFEPRPELDCDVH